MIAPDLVLRTTFDDGEQPRPNPECVVRPYGNEAVAWAPSAPVTFLDPVTALVRELVDGEVTVRELVSDVHEVLGIPVSLANTQIQRALGVLARAQAIVTTDVDDYSPDLFFAPENH